MALVPAGQRGTKYKVIRNEVEERDTKGGCSGGLEGSFHLCSCLRQPSPQTCPQPQVTMEEEDESRGKTEESGEDRGDGPPDRDPALSPSAFILVRQLGAVRSGDQGSHALKYWLRAQALNLALRKISGSMWTLAAGCLEYAFQTAG